MLRRIGVAAFAAYILLPLVTFVVLAGLATNWWVAGTLAGAVFALLVTSYAASRSPGRLGRAFGTAGFDPTDYSQWTRYLVVRPLVTSLPMSGAIFAAIFTILGFETSPPVTVAVVVASLVVGFASGEVLWSWLERRRKAS